MGNFKSIILTILILLIFESCAHKSAWTEVTPSSNFGTRVDPHCLVYKNELWLIGGKKLFDAWHSNTGISWTQAAIKPSNSLEEICDAFVYQDKMWILGETLPRYPKDLLLSSSDGTSWNETRISMPYTPGPYKAVVFKNKVWLFGGNLSEIWSSNDLTHWKLEAKGVPFLRPAIYTREVETPIVFNDQIWIVLGNKTKSVGADQRGPFKEMVEIWNSSDGIHWSIVPTANVFPSRLDYGMAVFDKKLWVLGGAVAYKNDSGGMDLNYMSDAWFSTDGSNWIETSTDFSPRTDPSVIAFDDKLWLLGGVCSATIAEKIGRIPNFLNNVIFHLAIPIGEPQFPSTDVKTDVWYLNK
jgi:hypothetical protein